MSSLPRFASRSRRTSPARRLPWASLASVLLHVAFLALLVVANLEHERPSEPLPPPSFDVEFENGGQEGTPGAPEAPQQFQQSLTEPTPETPPPAPEPTPPTVPAPPVVEAPPLPPQPVVPPPAPQPPQLAEPPSPPPPQPPEPEQAVAELPLPPPPPPIPPPPRPPRPAEPAPRLPGIYVPRTPEFNPPRPPGQTAQPSRRRLDLSLDHLSRGDRMSPEATLNIDPRVGADWRAAFRRWLDQNLRYPRDAAEAGEDGTLTLRMQVAPDGRVTRLELIRPSRSVFLNIGAQRPFRNAMLPRLPPGIGGDGIPVELTIHFNLIRPGR